jgi:hypothetical protein
VAPRVRGLNPSQVLAPSGTVQAAQERDRATGRYIGVRGTGQALYGLLAALAGLRLLDPRSRSSLLNTFW